MVKRKAGKQKKQSMAKAIANDPSIREVVLKGQERIGVLQDDNKVNQFELGYLGWKDAGLRLANLLESYERFHVRNLRFEYKPAVSAVTDGEVWFYPDYDPEDTAPTTEVMMTGAMGQYNAKTGLVRHAHTINMPNFKIMGDWQRPPLYVAPMDRARFTQYGTLYAYTYGAGTGSTVGSIVMHYDIVAFIPCIGTSNVAMVAGEDTTVSTPDAGVGGVNYECSNYGVTGSASASNDTPTCSITGYGNQLHTCILSGLTDCLLEATGADEGSIKPGERLWYEYCSREFQNSTDLDISTSGAGKGKTNLLGRIALDPLFTKLITFTATSALNAGLAYFTKVRKLDLKTLG